MNCNKSFTKHFFAIFGVVILNGTALLRADIDGFENIANWQYNQNDSGNPASVGPDFIQLTNGTGQRRSFWFKTKQNINNFSVSFRYQVAGGNFSSNVGGTSFIIQNESLDAVTDSNFEYGFGGIAPSAGVTFELNGSTGQAFSGVYRNGEIGTGAEPLSPHSPGGNGIDVTISYDGFLLTRTVDNGEDAPLTQTVFVTPEFAETLGSGKAWIGFGASTTSNLDQTIRNFHFSSSSGFLPGDVNQDGCVDLLDVQPFVTAVASGDYVEEADLNGDGTVDLLDVQHFVELLIGK